MVGKKAALNSKRRRASTARPAAGEPESSQADPRRRLRNLGQRLRTAREEKNIGLRELARRLGVSPSLISQIETGKTEPSINTLFAIVSELELPVNEIVFTERDADRSAPAPSATPADGSPDNGRARPAGAARLGRPEPLDSPVQRRDSRMSISLENGVTWQRLTPHADHNVDFLYLRYPPGSESTPAHSLMRHNGTEYGYILSGTLEVSIGFEKYELGPGDTIAFDCTQPHRFATVGDEPVEAVWFVLGRRGTLAIDDAASWPPPRPPIE